MFMFFNESEYSSSNVLNESINDCRGVLVEREYLDSTFNTDNAWLELICHNFHDHDCELPDLSRSLSAYRWTKVSEISFNKSKHSDLVNRVKFMRSQY